LEKERDDNKKEKILRKKAQKTYIDSLANISKVPSFSTVFDDRFAIL
jgi:hypothetical protein